MMKHTVPMVLLSSAYLELLCITTKLFKLKLYVHHQVCAISISACDFSFPEFYTNYSTAYTWTTVALLVFHLLLEQASVSALFVLDTFILGSIFLCPAKFFIIPGGNIIKFE